MGPFPLEDTFRMKAACIMLIKYLDTGKFSTAVKFSMRHKMQSTFSNIYHASSEGYSSTTVLAKDTWKLLVIKCSTYSPWFEHFIRGCQKCMGPLSGNLASHPWSIRPWLGMCKWIWEIQILQRGILLSHCFLWCSMRERGANGQPHWNFKTLGSRCSCWSSSHVHCLVRVFQGWIRQTIQPIAIGGNCK